MKKNYNKKWKNGRARCLQGIYKNKKIVGR